MTGATMTLLLLQMKVFTFVYIHLLIDFFPAVQMGFRTRVFCSLL